MQARKEEMLVNRARAEHPPVWSARRRGGRCSEHPSQRARVRASGPAVVPGLGKGSPPWREQHAFLRRFGVATLEPVEAWEEVKAGRAVLLDVRFGDDPKTWRIEPSLSVPYVKSGAFGRLAGLSLWEFGIPVGLRGGVKVRDVLFVDNVREAVADLNTPLVLCDELGGSLVRDCASKGALLDLTRSMSLMAAYELAQAGYTTLSYVEGGYNGWYESAAFSDSLPSGLGTWPGDLQWFGYRQFVGNDPTKGARDD